jgi:hypothetical protein
MITEYGLLTTTDAELIGDVLANLAGRFHGQTLELVEIGIREGKTSRAIARHMTGTQFRYWAVDSARDMPVAPPFQEAHLVLGDSTEVYHRVPAELHFVLIDGCHCVNHVALDFLHYGARVTPGGVVVFHDSGRQMQGKDYQQHGPRELPEFSVGVRLAIKLLGIERHPAWMKVGESDGSDWGGAMIFQRVPGPASQRA